MNFAFNQKYYKKLILEFGYNPLFGEKINFNLGKLKKEQLRTRWLCHNGADKFSSDYKKGKKVIVSTGIGLSGIPHMGTLTQIFNAITMQKGGVKVQMVLGDLDAYNGKNIPLLKTLELAKKYKDFILKLGFETNKGSIIRSQYDAFNVLRTMYLSGKYMVDSEFDSSEEELHEYYVSHGKVDKHMNFRRKLSLALMTADFIDLIISEDYEDVLVMLGIDEHLYVDFAQKTLQKMKKGEIMKTGFIGAIYSPIIKGFNNHPKMSKSFPDSTISVEMSKAQIYKRIMEGEGVYKMPESNVVFQMMSHIGNYNLSELQKIYQECKLKSKKWFNYKEIYVEKLIDIFKLWH
ncbi:hypothetical protein A3D00_01075 [Candidatus Woesebacteria bacterium RIFCSPHIGHO2_02_FULL_38_9]|uniref:Tryptophanyl-tRNA synthetase n=1 Tax=Candidatus Woesebacteria bacterium RIFCSPHIGHO2_01_FULL_39_28 TaxID=1802496 RepID=A0A1F7YJD1_9BACT|nr:MAG: hypothetical protein A2627_01320 [Candidatus Woesebacteria bacterium RIFCSPHIGHO2_01_FULL_39_28]OGM31715.1 MAG: hypothetical protein A3D00_01075 [Candidatus Woesebacteria bacterium RIFCSPHIGHO2_02_FULL_38_9]OGM57656.1 MAG: hypothetical protein A3A50_01450 [Candidatus Woesebacteria bacterium RIFCSPLOWO2_01_FULL_38_20]